jgi:hypothetical protein
MRTEPAYTFDATKVAAAAPTPGQHPSADARLDRKKWRIKDGVSIRDSYYKKNFREDNLEKVLKKAATGKTNSRGQELYKCAGGWGPNHIPFPTKAQLEIDHKTEVTTHWNAIGRKTIHDARNNWCDNPAHLVVLCGSCNASKPKGTYLRDVEVGFRGPND